MFRKIGKRNINIWRILFKKCGVQYIVYEEVYDTVKQFRIAMVCEKDLHAISMKFNTLEGANRFFDSNMPFLDHAFSLRLIDEYIM